jgi:hypothetical protein
LATACERWPLTLGQAAAFTTTASAVNAVSNTLPGVDPVRPVKLEYDQAAINGVFELDDGSGKKT